MPLFLIFLAVPLVEIALFIRLGGFLGLWPTLFIVVVTALAGTALIRSQGAQTLRRIQLSLEAGHDPSGPLAHGALILFAGALLLTPGFFTDAVGMALMFPSVRAALIRHGGRWLARRMVRAEAGRRTGQRQGGTVIDGEYQVLDDRDDRPGDRR